jgi:hypothetical protein
LIFTDVGWKVLHLPGGRPEVAKHAYAMANIANHLAAEISEGKFATVSAVSSELFNRLEGL